MNFSSKAVLITLMLVLTTGCVHLTHSELEFLDELDACGISKTERMLRDPIAAGGLSLFGGAGNMYLAVNTGEHWQYLVGAANFLFWPGSALWAVPQTITDANMINMRETVHYYRHDPHGRDYLGRIQKRYRNDPNSSCGKFMQIEDVPATLY